MLNDFGRIVRKARIDTGYTLLTMANELEVSPAFLSSLETGRRTISPKWAQKIETFFASKNCKVPHLKMAAHLSNKFISLNGLTKKHQVLVSLLACQQLNEEQLDKLEKEITYRLCFDSPQDKEKSREERFKESLKYTSEKYAGVLKLLENS